MRIFLLLFTFFLATSIQAQLNWTTSVDSCNFFSSPYAVDLNEDGILDIILGGGVEYQKTSSAVIAFNGKTGEILWEVGGRSQNYTSPLFLDVNGDKVFDVLIGGRDAMFYCINGKSGEIIWEFWNDAQGKPYEKQWLNFYNCQFTADKDGDSLIDLLTVNAGDHYALPSKKQRPTARFVIVSSKTGKVISQTNFSDQKESYYAPHTFVDSKGIEQLIYGCGGETLGGNLRIVKMSDFEKGKLSKSKVLLSDTTKGFIVNAIVADLNTDNNKDLVSVRMNGGITAFDIQKKKTLWEHMYPGFEAYVTPSFAYFNNDQIPDVFTIFAQGTFPQYLSFKTCVFDGKTGEILYEDNLGNFQFSPGVSLDMNGDGLDEILYIENQFDMQKGTVGWKLKCIHSDTKKATYLSEEIEGCSMASSPLIVDLDKNGTLELVVATSSIPMSEDALPSSRMTIIPLNVNGKVTWNGYLGKKKNGEL